MIPQLFRSLFDDSQRGDDRSTVDGARAPSGKPLILRRHTIHLGALVGIAAVLYGTLVPFQIDPNATLSWRLRLHLPVPEDAIANVLIYVPIGAFLRLLFRRRGSWRALEVTAALLTAGTIGYLSEVGQTLVAARIPSWTDLICNLAGAAAGTVLAPPLQRALRNWHGWLHHAVRTAPLNALATVVLACIWVHALAPFDIHPTPGHIARAWLALKAGLPGPTSEPNYWLYDSLTVAQVINKLAAAGSYGLLAFLLVLAAREAGRSNARALWYGMSRSAALVAAIEVLQLFTLSHVADWRDAILAWTCGGLGTLAAAVLGLRAEEVHRRPAAVLRGTVAAVALVLALWAVSMTTLGGTGERPAGASWLPIVSSFDRSWSGLLGDYATGLVQCVLTAALLALWCRSHHRVPRASWLVAVAVLTAVVIRVGLATIGGGSADSGQILIAIAAGILVVRADRAVFGPGLPKGAPASPIPVDL